MHKSDFDIFFRLAVLKEGNRTAIFILSPLSQHLMLKKDLTVITVILTNRKNNNFSGFCSSLYLTFVYSSKIILRGVKRLRQ